MAAQDDADNGYYTDAVPTPQDVAQSQQDAYQKSQQSPNATTRAYGNIQAGIQGFFGGGPQMNQAKAIQARLQQILQGVNQNSDPDEDPINKQLRTANAIANGMVDLSPKMALAALDQTVKLSQAKTQQSLLGLRTQAEKEDLEEKQYALQVKKNTPIPYVLAQDAGKDANGLPLGYTSVKSYDLSEPDAAQQMRADMLAAKANGQTLIPMTMKDLVDNKTQAQIARGQYALQKAYVDGANRVALADQKGSAMNDRFADRIMSSADLGTAALSNVASMSFGANSGYLGGTIGAKEGANLQDIIGGNLRDKLSTQDQQLYNTVIQGLGRNLTNIEMQGGLQGGQSMAKQLSQSLAIYPEDTPLTIMGKLAEARQILDRGTEIYLNSPKADPGKVAIIQKRLDDLHQAVPFTVPDVIAFNKASKDDPGLSYTQWAQKNKIGNSDSQASSAPAKTYTEADIQADMAAHKLTREQVVTIYARKGYKAAQ